MGVEKVKTTTAKSFKVTSEHELYPFSASVVQENLLLEFDI